MRLLWAAIVAAYSSSVSSAELEAVNELPFRFSLMDVGEDLRGDTVTTSVRAVIKNGSDYLSNVAFQCFLENAAGYSWEFEATVRNIDPDEGRELMLIGENRVNGRPELVSGAISARCKIVGFRLWPE